MKRLTYEYVKTFIENVDGYSLISTEYKNKINPLNKQIGRYKYHLDHKYSIYQGFLDKIDPKIISSINNLEVLSEYENCSKGISCSITKEELISEYNRKN
jgi:hypothetical protein